MTDPTNPLQTAWTLRVTAGLLLVSYFEPYALGENLYPAKRELIEAALALADRLDPQEER